MPGNQAVGQVSVMSLGWSRWGICALLFFATTLNYIDRQVIGILKPDLAQDLGWSEIDYSNIVFAFQVAYAIGYGGAGRLIDRIGVRRGYFLAVLLWSLAAMAHTLIRWIPPDARVGDWAAPRQAVSSVVGIGGMAGAIGGMLSAKLIGYVLQWTGSYAALFGVAATAYLVNLAIIHALNPRLEPMQRDLPSMPGR